jgi:hypothetical protein
MPPPSIGSSIHYTRLFQHFAVNRVIGTMDSAARQEKAAQLPIYTRMALATPHIGCNLIAQCNIQEEEPLSQLTLMVPHSMYVHMATQVNFAVRTPLLPTFIGCCAYQSIKTWHAMKAVCTSIAFYAAAIFTVLVFLFASLSGGTRRFMALYLCCLVMCSCREATKALAHCDVGLQ